MWKDKQQKHICTTEYNVKQLITWTVSTLLVAAPYYDLLIFYLILDLQSENKDGVEWVEPRDLKTATSVASRQPRAGSTGVPRNLIIERLSRSGWGGVVSANKSTLFTPSTSTFPQTISIEYHTSSHNTSPANSTHSPNAVRQWAGIKAALGLAHVC